MVARKKRPQPDSRRPALQWLAAAIGIVVTLAAIGIVLWEALQPPAPPGLTARVERITPVAGRYVVDVRVSNAGDDTAGAVVIEGVSAQEISGVTIDYVPGHGHASGHLQFEGEPDQVELQVKGWAEP